MRFLCAGCETTAHIGCFVRAQRAPISRPHSGPMTSEHIPADDPSRPELVWGAPAPAPRRWGRRETVAAVGVAVVIAGFGGVAIYAATDDGSAVGGGPHPAFGPGAMRGAPPDGMADQDADAMTTPPLHGEFVVSDANGGYTTVLTHTGTVTAVSAASIPVRSDDGYKQTYMIQPITGSTSRRSPSATRSRSTPPEPVNRDVDEQHRPQRRRPGWTAARNWTVNRWRTLGCGGRFGGHRWGDKRRLGLGWRR